MYVFSKFHLPIYLITYVFIDECDNLIPQPKYWLLLFLAGILLIAVCSLTPFAQDPAYHQLADTQRIWNIPNFWNVVSNLFFVLIGLYGLYLIFRIKVLSRVHLLYAVLFTGILFTGIGSAYYHLHPNNDTLVMDRLGMTVLFTAYLAVIAGEHLGTGWGLATLLLFQAIGMASVLYWHQTEIRGAGDLRFYALVQIYPVLFIPLIIVLFPLPDNRKRLRQFFLILALYALAKVCEVLDQEIFSLSGFLSGHTLKHLLAGVATWILVRDFRTKKG